MACSCQSSCSNTCIGGCPIQLDFDCILYHKDNNETSALTNLALTNGATLNLFAETVDTYIGQIKVPTFNLPCLRTSYTINTLKQFAEAVDTEVCGIKSTIDSLATLVNLPITPQNSTSINITVSGTNNHTVKGDVNISSTANNLLSLVSDGLYSAPQVLSIDYALKQLSISNGNTIDLGAISCGTSGFMGNVIADPNPVLDGQYWYNTTTSQLKFRVNGSTKVIVTV